MKRPSRRPTLSFLPTIAILFAAYLSLSPWGHEGERLGQRGVASVELAEAPALEILAFPNAHRNVLAPYGWDAMKQQISWLDIAIAKNNQLLAPKFHLSETDEDFLNLSPSVVGASLMLEMQRAVLGMQQNIQIWDARLAALTSQYYLAAPGDDGPDSLFVTRGDMQPLFGNARAKWIASEEGTKAWGAQDPLLGKNAPRPAARPAVQATLSAPMAPAKTISITPAGVKTAE